MENKQIADVFNRMADILDIQGENPFRIRSYRNAARMIEEMSESVESWAKSGKALTDIKGIGESLAQKIEELLRTGKLKALRELEEKVPEGLVEMLKLEGLGPKKVKMFYDTLKADSVDKLEKLARSGKVRGLPGMGERSEDKLLKAIEHFREGRGRFKLSVGMQYAEALVQFLKDVKGIKRLEPAGSLRRSRETIGDLDILAIADRGSPVMEKFLGYDDAEEVIAQGETKSAIRLKCGLQVDVRVVAPESFGAALHYFTGSKAHNIAIRERARERGLKVNEYGVFRAGSEKPVSGREEEEVFSSVGLPFIPPELREARGEIEAAEKGKLPRLIEQKDIRGDLQMHTTLTDGRDTVTEMVRRVRDHFPYEYMAITDHSKAVRVAHGLDEKKLAQEFKEIEKVKKLAGAIRILKGVEVDILEDGKLDLDDSILKECDVVIASVHSKFNMSERDMTERIKRALGNRWVNILGHPTGRLILEREPYRVDLESVIKTAKDEGVALELNAHPDRLDLRDVDAQMAKEMGAKVAISTDAHSAMQLDLMRFGVFTARRGWLEPGDVINTLPYTGLLKALGRAA